MVYTGTFHSRGQRMQALYRGLVDLIMAAWGNELSAYLVVATE